VQRSSIQSLMLSGVWPQTLGISEEEVVKNIMLRNTVDGQFSTLEDVAEVCCFLGAFKTTALTGQSITVSHGWNMS
jgi:3-hydroxybutyrate dehydrogenase